MWKQDDTGRWTQALDGGWWLEMIDAAGEPIVFLWQGDRLIKEVSVWDCPGRALPMQSRRRRRT